jgi:hypothetical protein
MDSKNEAHHVLHASKRQNNERKLLFPCRPAPIPEKITTGGGEGSAPECLPPLSDMFATAASKRSLFSSLIQRHTIVTRLHHYIRERLGYTIEKRDEGDGQKWYDYLGGTEPNTQVPVDEGRIAYWQPWHGMQSLAPDGLPLQPQQASPKIINQQTGLGVRFSCGATSVLIISSPLAAIMIHLKEGRAPGMLSFTAPNGQQQTEAVSILQVAIGMVPLTNNIIS